MNNYKNYYSILESLINKPLDATEDNCLKLMPYAVLIHIKFILTINCQYIAIPALKITNSYNVIYINKGKIYFIGHRRTTLSYPLENNKVIPKENLFIINIREAIEYSNSNWKNKLITVDWAQDSLVVYNICNPSIKHIGYTGGCKHIGYIYAIYKYGFNKAITMNTRDEDLLYITNKLLIINEMSYDQTIYSYYICSLCYGGLAHNHCTKCNKRFPSDITIDQFNNIYELHPLIINIINKKNKITKKYEL